MLNPRRWLVAPLVIAAGVMPLAFGTGVASAASLPQYGAQPCSETFTVTPTTVAAGGSVTITLSGTCFTDVFTVTLHSTPVVLGTITTSAAGSGAGTFGIPSNVPPGAHSITVTDAAGNTAMSSTGAAAAITVTPASPSVPAAATPSASSSLPFTGTDAVAVAAAGAGALCVGGLLVLASRKRRRDGFA